MYSLPYIILIVTFGLLSILWVNTESESNKHTISFAGIFIFIFFFGFRGFICDDWISYYPAFQKCSLEYINLNPLAYNIEWGFEPGFTLLMYLSKSIVENFHFFVFLCTFINVILLVLFFKGKVGNMPLALVIFLTFGGYVMSTNLMRNSIAILIFVNSIRFLEERKFIQYILLCLLASAFHISALLYIPLYFIVSYKYNKWIYIVIFAIVNFIFLLHVPIITTFITHIFGDADGLIQKKLESYTTGNMAEMKTLSIGYLERLFTGILIICYYDKLCEIRKGNIIFINLFLLYVSSSFMLSEFSEISLRISNLFICAYWVLWIDMINCFSIKNNQKLYIGFIALYCVIKMASTNIITSEYDNVLFGSKSYEERLYIHNRYSKN